MRSWIVSSDKLDCLVKVSDHTDHLTIGDSGLSIRGRSREPLTGYRGRAVGKTVYNPP